MSNNTGDSVKTASITLEELLNSNLVIPEYQRPYVWSAEQILKFFKRLEVHYSRAGNAAEYPYYYLGCIVLHKDNVGFNVIDGQQRLTTLLLVSVLKGNLKPDLKFYHPLSYQMIKENYLFLEGELKDPDSLISRVLKQIDFSQLNVTTITTDDEDQAYSFFETLNTGGVRLSGTDILKAHHLRSVPPASMKDFARSWENRQHYLEDINRSLLKARKLTSFDDTEIPEKYSTVTKWKAVLTEEFAEKTGKAKDDFGFADVLIKDNTHKVLSNKYSIRQPLNDGENYINYLLSFTDEFQFIFHPDSAKEFYNILNEKVINVIDGTVDLRTYYQLALICCADKFGLEKIEIFAFWLFRFIYALRISEKTRIYEPTVVNLLKNSKLLHRIFSAYIEDEVLDYLKMQKFEVKCNIDNVRARFLHRVNDAFELGADPEDFKDLDEKLKQKMRKDYAN